MNTQLEKIIEETLNERTAPEMALGWLRYETLRRLSPRQYANLCAQNFRGAWFDELVTGELLKWKGEK